jgi:cation diffusion facilitator CzcD-associated flavoprotein CzcO
MSAEEVEVAVVGGGQAGIAASEHLGNAGVPHVILERGRIAEKWRSGRWDSLVANGPAWHDRFPGLEFDTSPETFVPKEQVASFAADLRASIAAGDANYLSLLDEADAYIALNGLDLPAEPAARVLGPDPDCVTNPLLELDLAGAGVTSVIWATGYAIDFGWLRVDIQRGYAAYPAAAPARNGRP